MVSSCLSCRGVVRVDINLQDVDIDQCSDDGWFAGTHRCNATTMEVSVPNTRIRQEIDSPPLKAELWRTQTRPVASPRERQMEKQ